jgi:hypothetical protein
MLRKAAQVSDLCNSKYQPPRDGIKKGAQAVIFCFQICNNRKKLLLSARFYEKNENRGGNQRSPEEKRKASMEEAQKILDQIFETTSMMKGQVKLLLTRAGKMTN